MRANKNLANVRVKKIDSYMKLCRAPNKGKTGYHFVIY